MFVNSSIPYLESSRPIPLCRTPPNGIRGSETTTLFTVTSPAETSLATFSALLVSVPQTLAPRPNSLLLASLIASLSSLTAMTGAAGRNVSSWMILLCGVWFVRIVGASHDPFQRSLRTPSSGIASSQFKDEFLQLTARGLGHYASGIHATSKGDSDSIRFD